MSLENEPEILDAELSALSNLITTRAPGAIDHYEAALVKQLLEKLQSRHNPNVVLYRDAINKWGENKQLRKLQEECGELVAAINQEDLGRDPEHLHLAEEIADVEILIGQARMIVGHSLVEVAKEKKLLRLRQVVDDPNR